VNNIECINYSHFFNNNVVASQILFDSSFKFSPLIEYRKLIIEKFSISSDNLAVPEQVHSNRVRWITKNGSYQNTDGLITDNNDLILSLQTADCVPIFIFDQLNNIKGLVHSGWRGTKNKIINNAINLMIDRKSEPSNIFILLGASIQKCCYEVGKDFINYFDYDCIYQYNNKIYLSLQEQIRIDLCRLNIPLENIYVDHKCTFMNSKLSSYRRDKGEAGRMISLLGHY